MATEIPVPTADVVGNAFVHQYYMISHQSPELVHRFYQDVSKLGRPEPDGIMSTTTTMHAINEKILSLGYGDFSAEITTVDSQESYNGGVIVLVTGYLTGTDNVRRKFTQSFFLAPQDKGYFVLNDVFRYVDDANYPHGSLAPVNNVEAPLAPEHDLSSVQVNTNEVSEEINGGEVYNPSENGDGSIDDEEAPVPEVVDEIPDDSPMEADSQIVPESNSKIDETPKKSYASIVKVLKENAAPFSSLAASPLRSAPKSQEQVAVAVPAAPVSDTNISSLVVAENEQSREGEAEGPSIYVRGLPLDATPALLEDEFKKFGIIRPDGIQVRCQKGFCFGFVEFDSASAVHSALKASPLNIGGSRVIVEEKRSTSRGNNRGRFSSGSGGGYRNDGVRGRGNFGGGKSYSRGDFGNRSDSGNRGSNRGGYPNHGGDGFRRGDKMGGRGNNRGGGFSMNAAAKGAPRVPATA